MKEEFVLQISADDSMLLDGVVLRSTNDVAEALGKLKIENPDATISIEADDSSHYDAIGKAIYVTQWAGFAAERVRIVVGGKLLP